jgi:integrase
MNGEDAAIIEKWFLRRNIGEGTQSAYLIAFKQYCELIGMTPFELYEEADDEEESGVRPIKSKVYDYLLKYKKYLKDTGKSKKTLKLYFAAVRSFYLSFDITLPDIKLDSGDIGLEKNIGRPLNRKDVKKLANSAAVRERALIYLMAMTGMGQQEARDLTIKKFIECVSSAIGKEIDDVYDLFKFEDEILQEILTLNITRQKTSYSYITFIPPEASREIIHYLKERCYGRNENIRVENNSEYIFASKYGGQMSRDSIVTNFRHTGIKAGFKKEKNAYSFWRSHSLRKYFISTFINKKGEKVIADFMAGHKISDMDRTYWQANPDDLKTMYIDALPALSLDDANVKDYETKEFRELNAKLKESENESQNMKNEFREILLMNLEIDQLKETISMVENGSAKAIGDISELQQHLDKLKEEVIKKINNITVPNKNEDDYLLKVIQHAEIMDETKDKNNDI